MNNVNVNKNDSIKLIKSFIQDLSYENPQNINENNSVNNNNNDLDINMNVILNLIKIIFSVLNIKYNLDCSTKQSKIKLFNLELDYFGFLKINNNNDNHKLYTEIGIKVLFPFIKEIIEYTTQRGGSVPILLNETDFDLKKVRLLILSQIYF